MSEIIQDDDGHFADTEEGYDIDTPIDMIQTNFHHSTRQVNANQRRTPTRPPTPDNTMLPSDVWSQPSQNFGLRSLFGLVQWCQICVIDKYFHCIALQSREHLLP